MFPPDAYNGHDNFDAVVHDDHYYRDNDVHVRCSDARDVDDGAGGKPRRNCLPKDVDRVYHNQGRHPLCFQNHPLEFVRNNLSQFRDYLGLRGSFLTGVGKNLV